MLTKYLLLASVVLGLLTAGSVTLAYRMSVKAGAAQAEVARLTKAQEQVAEALKASQALSARLAKEKAAMARQEARKRLRVEEALIAEPTWAQTPVPKEVQDALAE